MNEGVRTFPTRDAVFAREVEHVLELVYWRTDQAAVDAATRELRRLYPNALLRWSDDMGGYAAPTCYAFRDGRVRPDDSTRERLYAALARSRQVAGDAQRLLATSAGRDGEKGDREAG